MSKKRDLNMDKLIIAIITFVLLVHFTINILRIRRLSNEIESLRFEQDKMNFRLFVAEMKQKNNEKIS